MKRAREWLQIGDKVKGDAQHITPDGSTGGAGVVSTNFTSIMHNLVNQLLLAMKVKPAVEMAICRSPRRTTAG